jgi:1-acyl-sn-glycerol-3-phosphate acyltransferase
MFRACLAFIGVVIGILIWATPVWLAGLIYPSRSIVAFGARWFGRFVMISCGARLRVVGAESVRDGVPRFYVGNHQSALDISALLVALDGNVRFLAKESLFRIPIFGWAMRRSEFIPVDRSNARNAKLTIEAMLERFRKRPISLVIFPEGTRSRDGQLLPFRKGAMKICSRAALPIVPFAIDGSGQVSPAKQFRIRPGLITLRFAQPIAADEVASLAPDKLHDRVRAAVEQCLEESRELRCARTPSSSSMRGEPMTS